MSSTVCIGANTFYGPRLGGHFWVYLNWALGARSNGCRVIWLEGVEPRTSRTDVRRLLGMLREGLEPFGLAGSVALCSWTDDSLSDEVEELALPSVAAYEADAFLNLAYVLPTNVVSRFAKSVLVSIDPGLFELWLSHGVIDVPKHDLYVTTGAPLPDDGRPWVRAVPCVSLEQWPVARAPESSAFTTVSNWYANEWFEHDGEIHKNDKRAGFLPFLGLPSLTSRRLELALELGDRPAEERRLLLSKGWRVVDAASVASTPSCYRRYIQSSLGEFSCAKPSSVRLGAGWVSDRTLCYLASGKPVVVQDTGPTPVLPHGEGAFRFSDLQGAAMCLQEAAGDYDRHCKAARALAEEHFDASRVVGDVLSRGVGL